ncbi:RusA family crossover junction endodeoxyribonuclease [Hydrogenothermus marinus]|uniref:Crossover junction endodeoxyribonuclease RusA n=1 Tax=Hydrogenothermus marinus TaxID=133270 RepID=A0A3M0BNY7_9AQUI|nr:RusA family crossover junction endodeoxyribonuclease [Hydrogenothermus marinus]RMA96145.1 crossover junction endodeoxyribonuclease RusA [Hydrogenothermus marinus]
MRYFLSFIPPSKANRVKIKNKRYIIPKDVSLKINRAIWELQKQQEKINKTFLVPVEVDITFILPNKRRRDLDNIMKTVGDCMVYAKILKDDNLIYKQKLEKIIIPNKEGIIIDIKKYKQNIKKINSFIESLNEFKEDIHNV